MQPLLLIIRDEQTKTVKLGFSPDFSKRSVWHKHKPNVVDQPVLRLWPFKK